MANAAVVLRVTPDASVYAGYATSYNPVHPAEERSQRRQGLFDPTRGTNCEVGVKFGARRATWPSPRFATRSTTRSCSRLLAISTPTGTAITLRPARGEAAASR